MSTTKSLLIIQLFAILQICVILTATATMLAGGTTEEKAANADIQDKVNQVLFNSS